jgi:hypothetical protein
VPKVGVGQDTEASDLIPVLAQALGVAPAELADLGTEQAAAAIDETIVAAFGLWDQYEELCPGLR